MLSLYYVFKRRERKKSGAQSAYIGVFPITIWVKVLFFSSGAKTLQGLSVIFSVDGLEQEKKLAEERSSDQSLLQSKKGEKEMGEKRKGNILRALRNNVLKSEIFF